VNLNDELFVLIMRVIDRKDVNRWTAEPRLRAE
jgi:hypothetical protein